MTPCNACSLQGETTCKRTLDVPEDQFRDLAAVRTEWAAYIPPPEYDDDDDYYESSKFRLGICSVEITVADGRWCHLGVSVVAITSCVTHWLLTNACHVLILYADCLSFCVAAVRRVARVVVFSVNGRRILLPSYYLLCASGSKYAVNIYLYSSS